MAPALNVAFDFKGSKIETIFNGSKPINDFGTDLGTGYLFYGLSSGTKHVNGLHKDIINSYGEKLMKFGLIEQEND